MFFYVRRFLQSSNIMRTNDIIHIHKSSSSSQFNECSNKISTVTVLQWLGVCVCLWCCVRQNRFFSRLWCDFLTVFVYFFCLQNVTIYVRYTTFSDSWNTWHQNNSVGAVRLRWLFINFCGFFSFHAKKTIKRNDIYWIIIWTGKGIQICQCNIIISFSTVTVFVKQSEMLFLKNWWRKTLLNICVS